MIPRWLCGLAAIAVSAGIIALAVLIRRSVVRRAEAAQRAWDAGAAGRRIGGDQ